MAWLLAWQPCLCDGALPKQRTGTIANCSPATGEARGLSWALSLLQKQDRAQIELLGSTRKDQMVGTVRAWIVPVSHRSLHEAGCSQSACRRTMSRPNVRTGQSVVQNRCQSSRKSLRSWLILARLKPYRSATSLARSPTMSSSMIRRWVYDRVLRHAGKSILNATCASGGVCVLSWRASVRTSRLRPSSKDLAEKWCRRCATGDMTSLAFSWPHRRRPLFTARAA
jgi:hypothetical protein